MVMAMASPAGRLENSSMPSQAVPASVRPTQVPQARKPKMDAINKVMTRASFIMGFFSVLGFWDTFAASYGFVDDGDKKYKCAYRHGDLRNPQWSGVIAGGDVVIGVRVEHQLAAEPAQIAGNKANRKS